MELEEVEKGYSGLARKYDKFFNFYFGRIFGIEKYRKEIIEWLGLKKGDTVLDIGCGRGLNFSFLQEKIGNKGKIIGIDYTKAMLDDAMARIKRCGWENITLIHGDAVRINEFVKIEADAVISTYCFTLLYDIERAFLNTLKVLKDKGPIAILDVKRTRPENRLARLVHPIYLLAASRCNIASAEDLDKEHVTKKWEIWQNITNKSLDRLKEKSFFFDTIFSIIGYKK